MTIQDDLDQLRAQTPGCELSAFGDLSSSLILRFSAESRMPREKLDQLCTRAERGFGVLELAKEFHTERVISFSESHTEVFARAMVSPDDIVCMAMEAGHDIETAAQAAQKLVQRYAEGDGS
mgnify:CR=1 FL=1